MGGRTGRQLGAIPFENRHRRRLSVLGEGPEISTAINRVSGSSRVSNTLQRVTAVVVKVLKWFTQGMRMWRYLCQVFVKK